MSRREKKENESRRLERNTTATLISIWSFSFGKPFTLQVQYPNWNRAKGRSFLKRIIGDEKCLEVWDVNGKFLTVRNSFFFINFWQWRQLRVSRRECKWSVKKKLPNILSRTFWGNLARHKDFERRSKSFVLHFHYRSSTNNFLLT